MKAVPVKIVLPKPEPFKPESKHVTEAELSQDERAVRTPFEFLTREMQSKASVMEGRSIPCTDEHPFISPATCLRKIVDTDCRTVQRHDRRWPEDY